MVASDFAVTVEFEAVDVNDLNLAGRVENLLANLLLGPRLDGSLDCSLKGESETKRSCDTFIYRYMALGFTFYIAILTSLADSIYEYRY